MTKEAGFTRTEVAVVAVGLLLGIAAGAPILRNRYERRAQAACIANLKQLDGACTSWALENKKFAANTYVFSDLVGYLKASVLPLCPRGGTYTPGKTIAGVPSCSIPGHTL